MNCGHGVYVPVSVNVFWSDGRTCVLRSKAPVPFPSSCGWWWSQSHDAGSVSKPLLTINAIFWQGEDFLKSFKSFFMQSRLGTLQLDVNVNSVLSYLSPCAI